MDTLLNLGLGNLTSGPEVNEVLLEREKFNTDSLKRIIRDLGLKVTEQRLVILKSLTEGRAHRTIQEVYESVHRVHAEIGFATVYRFLRDLAEAGIVTEIRMGGQPARYELKPSAHHDHLTCTQCGVIVEFHNAEIERLQELVACNNGFQLTGHMLELYGLCPKCQKAT